MSMTEQTAPSINLMALEAWAHGQPHDQFQWLRDHHPVYWHAWSSLANPGRVDDGFWAVTSYEGVHTVLRDNATYSSLGYVGTLDVPPDIERALSFIAVDAPRHTLLRKIISDRFTPAETRKRVQRFRQIASTIIDETCERGECEFVQEVAGKMASYIGAELLGIPRADSVALYKVVETLHGVSDEQDPNAVAAAQASEDEYCRQVWREKRTHPQDDIATQLAFGKIGDKDMTEEEFVPNLGLLVHGSSDTTRNLIAGGILALLDNPDQMAILTGDIEDGIPIAVEEMLRWLSPVAHVYRLATKDTELCGQAIRRGDRVVPWYGAANRDPAKFPHADRFDVRRHPNDHIAFGFAGHFCLGVHIGRLQGRAMVSEVLHRLPDIQVAGPVRWLASTLVSGPSSMPVTFSPTAPAAPAA